MTAVIWHEVECGAYAADLELWEELALGAQGPILDLGCGTGRVALHLARRGHPVTGLDLDPDFVAAFDKQAQALPADTVVADARSFDLGVDFNLIVAPMQLLQLFATAEVHRRCLRCVAAHMNAGGRAAFAIVESMPEPSGTAPPLPDTREIDGWVYSSLPVDARVDSEWFQVRRLRQTVSPQGKLEEELYEIDLRTLDAATLEAEARDQGLRATGRRAIPPTEEHVGSTVVLLEKAA